MIYNLSTSFLSRYGFALLAICALFLTLHSKNVSGQGKTGEKPLTAKEISARALPAVVLIISDSEENEAKNLGSGFFIRPGIVVTNYHVIRGMSRGVVQLSAGPNQPRKTFRIAKIVHVDVDADLAILSIPSGSSESIPSIPLESGLTVQTGEAVYALGNPEGFFGTISPGIVSAPERSTKSHARIQITNPISEGSSGGPLVNEYGRVVGVVVGSISTAQNLNFAIPVRLLTALIKESRFPATTENVVDRAAEMNGKVPSDWDWSEEAEASQFAWMLWNMKNDCPPLKSNYLLGAMVLQGIRSVRVLVERLDPQVEGRVLDATSIKSRLELNLRRNGIRVSESLEDSSLGGILYLNLNCMDINSGIVCAYHLGLNQTARSEINRDNVFTSVETWKRSGIIKTGYASAGNYITKIIDDEAIEFANDFLKANPR